MNRIIRNCLGIFGLLAAALVTACGGGSSSFATDAPAASALTPQQQKTTSDTYQPAELPLEARNMQFALAMDGGMLQNIKTTAYTLRKAAGMRTGQAEMPSPIPADDFMLWAALLIPDLFPGLASTNTASSGSVDFVYRMYTLPNGAWNIIAITNADSRIFVMGNATGGALVQFGVLSDYTCSIFPQRCGSVVAGAISQEALALAFLNQERTRCGYAPLAKNANLDASTAAHTKYLRKNNLLFYAEDLAKQDFYAADPGSRAQKSGYQFWKGGIRETGGATSDSSPLSAIRSLLSGPYGSMFLIDAYSFRDAGVSFAPGANPALWNLVVDIGGSIELQHRSTNEVRTYPCAGTTNAAYVSRSDDSNPYTPSPFPSEASAQWGQAIVISGALDLRITSASITGPAGAVAIKALYDDIQVRDPNRFVDEVSDDGYCSYGTACLLPVAMAPNTTYTVTISGVNSSKSFTRNFSFTTAKATDLPAH